jgi:ABC-type glycerol-3-phosphate transport system substrate-binding protein
VVAVGAASLLAVAACSSSSNKSSSSSPATSAASAAPSSPAAGASSPGVASYKGQTFTILGQWTGGEQAAFQAVVNNFDKQTGASGKYTPAAGGNEATVLGTQVAGGTPPDIAILSLPGAIAQYAAAGKLKPLVAATQGAVKGNFASEWGTLGSYKGTEYGVPTDASDKSTVWYSAKAFSNAGIGAPPSTWTDLIKDAKTLADSGVPVPISIGGGDGWTLTDWFENVYIRTAGVAMYDKLTHHQIPWTDKSVTTALDTLKQIWGDTSLIGSPAKALTVPFTGSVDNVFKAKPTSALVYEASFVATTITSDKDPAKVGTEAKVFPFPSVNGSKPVLEAAGDFAVAFSAKPVVQAFLQYLAGPVAAKTLVSYPGSGFLTANKQMPSSDYPDPTSAQLGQQLVSVGNNFRFDMSDQAPAAFGGTPNKGEWAALQNFLKTGNVAAAQQTLEREAKAVKWS